MESEQNRRNTFIGTWTNNNVDFKKLALYGFYVYSHNNSPSSDTVKCFFCDVEISYWEPGDNPLREHLRWSPNCKLLRRIENNNIPIDAEEFNRSLPPVSITSSTLPIEYRPHSYPESSPEPENIKINYNKITDRLLSFADWPKYLFQKKNELSAAGFYYLGVGDQVKCFSCGGGLKDWELIDNAWVEHAINYPKCKYLIDSKSADFIENAKNLKIKQQEISKNVMDKLMVEFNDIDLNNKYKPIDESNLCKVCMDSKCSDIVLIPCMHVCVCAACGYSLNKCPICITPIISIKKIYFS